MMLKKLWRRFLRRLRLDLPFVVIDESGMARFFRRGVTKFRFAPAVANKNAPTRAEITAGSDLSPDVADVAGFSFSNDPIPTPDLESSYTDTIPGEDTTETSSLTFYDTDGAATHRTTQAKGTAGFIVIMPYGDIATKRCEVWPIKTTGVNDQFSMGNDPARFVVGYAITDTPAQGAVIPA